MSESNQQSEQPMSRRPWGWIAFGIYALLLAIGIGVVVLREPVVETPARQVIDEEIDWTGDLARWEKGAVARASSYHNRGQHHPMFAIDGQRSPRELLAKWTSWPDDRTPWLAVDLAFPTDIERVSIAHAGIREDGRYTVRDYQLVCLSDGRELKRQAIMSEQTGLATHAFECEGATSVRIEFQLGPADSPTGVARIYEVEVYGGPAR